jgi:myosin-5
LPEKNSFEQFCINYANEQLQQEFNAHVFKLEQEEYLAEQINWKFIDFSDNQPTIDVIEGKLGILALLDEESRLPAGSDSTLIQKLYTQLNKPANKTIFKKPRFGTTAFTIAHYAHDVTYEIEGFLEKNRDTVPDEHLAMLNSSSNTFLKEVIDRALSQSSAGKPDAAANVDATAAKLGKKAGGQVRKPTLGSIFKASLINLKETIDSTNAHYIRCIKPNEAKAPWEFEPPLVLSQLKACGVLETIRISCAGYPTRWTYEEFAERSV